MSDCLQMPWSIEDTINHLECIRNSLARQLGRVNFEGKATQDIAELNYDFDRAIKALKENQQYRQIGTLEHVREFDTLYLEKCQEVNELRKQTQWIPVEERLPEESGYYCVTTKNTVDGNRIEQTAWFAHKDDYYADASVWREIQSYEKVVAWRKSKPYNPESPQESPCNDAGWRQRMMDVFLGGKR